VAAALILFQIYAFPSALNESANRRQHDLLAKGALLLLNIVPDNPQIDFLGLPRPQGLVETANALNEMGYLHPPLIASSDAGLIAGQNSEVSGAMDGLIRDPAGLLHARGWAVYPQGGLPAECVFITYRDAGGHPIIFAAARMAIRRDDLAGRLPAEQLPFCGWEAILDPRLIPASVHTTRLEVWALDVETARATSLNGFVTIQR